MRPTACQVRAKILSFSSARNSGSMYQRAGIVSALARLDLNLKSFNWIILGLLVPYMRS